MRRPVVGWQDTTRAEPYRSSSAGTILWGLAYDAHLHFDALMRCSMACWPTERGMRQ